MSFVCRKGQTIWTDQDFPDAVRIIDQRKLPFADTDLTVGTVSSMAHVIKPLAARSAGCIGVSASFEMYLAAIETRGMESVVADKNLHKAAAQLVLTHPMATNLAWAVDHLIHHVSDAASQLEIH
mgnify:FL=1|jgi:methylthioribose-1-phosphate isomerase|tara:strand:+ start:42 stop:416 length:375 start_codon:yes stop_codon:yes gene_type:complete